MGWSMKILLAPDSFKGSLSAPEACASLAEGLRWVLPSAELVAARGGRWQELEVSRPLPAERPRVRARLGWLDPQTAVLEMASASGLPLVSPGRRNPWHTTSYGTGELIAAALDGGATRLFVGLGGSPLAPATALAPLLLPPELRLTPEQFVLVCEANPEAVLELASASPMARCSARSSAAAFRPFAPSW